MNISLGQELLIEADHIEGSVLRIIERFKSILVWLLYSKNIKIMPSVLRMYPLIKLRKK